MSLKTMVKTAHSWVREARQFSVPKLPRECPICGYKGIFLAHGKPSRWDGRCPNCGSRPRHRLVHLFLNERHIDLQDGRVILHFAPERHLTRAMGNAPNYHTADLVPGKARHAMDMADIKFSDQSIDLVIANHVLEHVPDDQKALREMFRVLRKGGFALITVPQNWAREETYENAEANKASDTRYAHYLDADHIRFYGRDFGNRLGEAGFRVECWRLPREQEVRYGLEHDEVVWLGWKD
jgi:SAM-dependent methyltransferase